VDLGATRIPCAVLAPNRTQAPIQGRLEDSAMAAMFADRLRADSPAWVEDSMAAAVEGTEGVKPVVESIES
jgi:hypothetical protein